jgi:hypothetical protein
MSFATDYLAQLEAFAARGPLPRIRALHLPPAGGGADGKGEFCALELDDGSLGLSYVLLGDTLDRLRGRRGRRTERRRSAGGRAPLRQRRLFEKTLGFAAANA